MPLIRKDTNATSQPGSELDSLMALASPESEVRWKAVRSLAKVPSSVPHLSKALGSETDQRIREALFTSLAHIQSRDAVEAVLPYLRSDDAATRTAALDALNAMSAAVDIYLPKLLADADPDIRILVCDIARHLPSPTATSYLCELLKTEETANVCASAVEALSEVGDSSALPVLAECAKRFANEPFLVFSINVASERIGGDARGPDGS